MVYVTSSYVILCLHASTPFCQHGKQCTKAVGKTATNCLFVRLLVAQNDIDGDKKLRLREKNVEKRSFGQ